MNENKEIPQGIPPELEAVLEKVTGGTGDEWGFSTKEWTFIATNCIGCRHDGPGTCPYGTDKHEAIRKAGGETCPVRELPDAT